MKYCFFVTCLFLSSIIFSQTVSYEESIAAYQRNYITTHGVVPEKDKKHIRFFPIDTSFTILSKFERIYDAPWFSMATSGKLKKIFRTYGLLHFNFKSRSLQLAIYQAQDLMENPDYADYLFIPFTDETNGNESYENGRYIDLTIKELGNGSFLLDFNKAYNPYCAFVSNTYNCPIPPKENNLPIAIKAGEMKFQMLH